MGLITVVVFLMDTYVPIVCVCFTQPYASVILKQILLSQVFTYVFLLHLLPPLATHNKR